MSKSVALARSTHRDGWVVGTPDTLPAFGPGPVGGAGVPEPPSTGGTEEVVGKGGRGVGGWGIGRGRGWGRGWGSGGGIGRGGTSTGDCDGPVWPRPRIRCAPTGWRYDDQPGRCSAPR